MTIAHDTTSKLPILSPAPPRDGAYLSHPPPASRPADYVFCNRLVQSAWTSHNISRSSRIVPLSVAAAGDSCWSLWAGRHDLLVYSLLFCLIHLSLPVLLSPGAFTYLLSLMPRRS
ncbi:hypothetical protein ASPFODRAFT_260979 [Aspergillus luchuensis CBS 106.47]|uniref:Uncharacterized protein n=1 Tax=Aspergillus luchuensis (strain CBS 106.47) TaxID=1137211 RepID=A0A1M3U0J5_ASPLC|nr:hypothetical protein ASPFODRAFT_260979 [Aspergillus luchuensis CBS 106.47]